jgi:hypothetical protein
MAAIDKLYGNQYQWLQLMSWLRKNQEWIECETGCILKDGKEIVQKEMVLPAQYINDVPEEAIDAPFMIFPIANFPTEIDEWLYENCPLDWVIKQLEYVPDNV